MDCARLALHKVLEDTFNKHQRCTLRSWVDDVMQAVQSSRESAVSLIKKAAITFAEGCSRDRLKISSKSTVISTDYDAAKEVVNALRSEGIKIKSARTAADLGIDRGSSRLRPKAAARKASAWSQVRKAAVLARFNTRTRLAARALVTLQTRNQGTMHTSWVIIGTKSQKMRNK